MELCYEEFKDDIEPLVEFLTSDTWDFLGESNPSPEKIRENYKNQVYTGNNNKTFWVISDQRIKVGMVRIYDLQDSTPLLDIRILSKYKGMGVGTMTINWLIDYIFNNFTDKERIEGNTRQDNYAMRCVFHKCGFVKEAHYRKSWKDKNGNLYDAIGYGLLKADWQKGKTTPVDWNDFKY
ncbi:GNAT family N-acetyltransferase [Paenibacillus monticola]|uniref:GNAT family N-acetyltransferase n=1 Tax=Paenibacillus monticola TaxID=2666075 RepID=A0A7X2L1V1_9BACL|nr:GNAT family N-acetyltransferase [Paenibacillus monticola]MRN52656.1 GNAT family N-acetyltransferase [Paenibacillus monticola]